MKMLFPKSLLCLAFLFGSIDAARNPRQILGGVNVNIKDYPYQVSLRYRGHHGCGGAIIGEKHILTAAHCISGGFVPPFGQATVNTGTSSSTMTGNSYRVARVIFHPQWKKNQGPYFLVNDIAILKLVDKIRFNAYQQEIGIATHDIISGTTSIVAGWGHTIPMGGRMSEQLKMIHMMLLSNADCQIPYSRTFANSKLHPKQSCEQHRRGQGTCVGDSGSPVVLDNKIVGIISYGLDDDCGNDAVDVITNVFAYKDFIEQELRR